jgi:signal transduction histidine kinase
MILEKMMHFMIENAGATKGVLLIMEEGVIIVQAARSVQNDSVETMIGIPMRDYSEIPHSIVNFTEKTRTPVILDNVPDDLVYDRDPYIRRTLPQSVLCMPIENKSVLIGILYLENNLSSGAFTKERFDLLKILGTQVAISIENARLYQNLENEVTQRTSDLKRALLDLEEKHDYLLRTQNQLIESEKMASLGTLVAGVAHEINNPANYLYISSKNLETEIANFHKEMLEMIDDGDAEANAYLDTRFDTFHRSLQHIIDGSRRINTIIQDLRSVSRLQDTYMEMIRVIESLDSSIRIVQAKYNMHIDFITDYHADPMLLCYPSELSQVFINIMVNSSQAIFTRLKNDPDTTRGKLIIRVQERAEEVAISFVDNGCGMTNEVQMKIFDPFFTTKPVGDGTGLGMYISFGIIQKHNGRFEITSRVGEGTVVTIIIPIEHT